MPLSAKYTPSDLNAVLEASLTPLRREHNGRHPICCYQGQDDNTFVFTCVSDEENGGSIGRTIAEALYAAKDYFDQKNIDLRNKKLVFPVGEEQPFLGFLWPRRHFVTLHYDTETRTATVIDSRPSWAAGFYSAEPMKQSLRSGLEPLGLTVDRIEVRYLGIQPDDIHCGAWTAVNIEGFARGTSLEDQLVSLVADDKDAMVQHNIDVVNQITKEPFISTVSRSDSTASLSESSEEAPAEIVRTGPVFTEELQNAWLNAAKARFRDCFEHPTVLSEVLYNYKGITLNGRFLNAAAFGSEHFDTVSNALVAKYTGILAESPTQYDYLREGYELKRPNGIKPVLEEIGISQEIIEALTVPDALIFAAVLGEAEFSAGHLAARAQLVMDGIEDALIQPEIQAFQMKLHACLLDEVMRQYVVFEAEKIRARPVDEVDEELAFFDAESEETSSLAAAAPPPIDSPLIMLAPEVMDAEDLPPAGGDIEPIAPPMPADFQLACLHALIIAGGVLLVIALLTCPPVAAALGITGLIGAAAAHAICTTAGIAGASSWLAGIGIFASRGLDVHDLDALRPGF